MRDADDPDRLFVDTSAWIALTSPRDQYHRDADLRFGRAIEREIPLITTNLVLAEAHRFLLFRAGPRLALTALDRIGASRRLTLHFADASHHRAAHGWLVRLSDQQITYTDAVSFAVMTSTKCRALLGFDHDFVVAGFTLWRG